MRRRDVLAGVSASVWALTTPLRAANRAQPFRVGLLSSIEADDRISLDTLSWLRADFAAFGWVEPRDVVLRSLFAAGDYGRFPSLMREMLAWRPDVVIVNTIAGARAAREASVTVPIVMLGLNNPVQTGLIASLARPGGTITGIATQNEDILAKVFRLVTEFLPSARRVAAIHNPANPSSGSLLTIVEREAARSQRTILPIEVALDQPAPLRLRLADSRPDVVLIIPDIALHGRAGEIVAEATADRIPVAGAFRELLDCGGALAYAPSRRELVRRTVSYLRRIAEGARPDTLPVEEPTTFTLSLNLRVARNLRIAVPPDLLAGADDILE